jgi:hypothetical protein
MKEDKPKPRAAPISLEELVAKQEEEKRAASRVCTAAYNA